MSTVTNPIASITGNPLQLAALSMLASAFQSARMLVVSFALVANDVVPTVSGYAVNASSICVNVLGEDGQILPDFPVIEVRRTGKFALPSIRSYREANVTNTLLPYPLGQTAFDAALFADSHAKKQGNNAYVRRAAVGILPVAPTAPAATPAPTAPAAPATGFVTGEQASAPTPAPTVEAPKPEPTAEELEKLTAPEQGKNKRK